MGGPYEGKEEPAAEGLNLLFFACLLSLLFSSFSSHPGVQADQIPEGSRTILKAQVLEPDTITKEACGSFWPPWPRVCSLVFTGFEAMRTMELWKKTYSDPVQAESKLAASPSPELIATDIDPWETEV